MMHLISLNDWSAELIHEVLDLGQRVKQNPAQYRDAMARKTLFMVFEKPSLRTRVSFEIGMNQMGGSAMYYDFATSPIGGGKETLHDTVKTVSRYADMIMARLFEHDKLLKMAKYASIPVINGLTNFNHPCQILADLLTISEKKGRLKGLRIAYLGDCNNNVTHSILFGSAKVGMHVSLACPASDRYKPNAGVLSLASRTAADHGAEIQVTHNAQEAVSGADVVYTDSWMSYHIDKEELEGRKNDLMPFQVNGPVMAKARPDAIFMNCLPAMRGYEQTAEVIDGPQSVVFDQAENRLHAQKAVMLKLLELKGQ